MFSFKKYFLENCVKGLMNLFESLKIKDYLESQPDSEEIYESLFFHPEMKSFIEKIDIKTLIKPLAVGKNGNLVINKSSQYVPYSMGVKYYEDDASGNPFQHRIPCKITKIENNEVELERTDGKDFEELTYKTPIFPDWKSEKSKKKILVPASRIILVNNEKYLVYTRWITYAVMKGSQESGRDISNYFDYFWRRSKDELYKSLNNDKIISLLRTTETSPEFFFSNDKATKEENLTYPDVVNKDLRGKEGGEGEVLIEFPNGWKWLNLNRGYCRKEGDAGGHCGNIGGGERNESILSLRDSENHVYLTFTLSNSGNLMERKGVGNRKPDKSLHPYIVKLLLHPIVHGLGVGHFAQENDFKLEDLSPEHRFILRDKMADYLLTFDNDSSKLSIELMKSIDEDNFNDFMTNLIKKHPQLSNFNIINYSYGKNFMVEKFPYYFAIINSGMKIEPLWLSNFIKKYDDNIFNQGMIRYYIVDNFLQFKKNLIDELLNYLKEIKFELTEYIGYDYDHIRTRLKSINAENINENLRENNKIISAFADAIFYAAAKDKNLFNVFYNTINEIEEKMFVIKCNNYLFGQRNSQGFYYSIYQKDRTIYVAKNIQAASIEKYLKECEEIVKEYENENGEIPSDDILESIVKPIDSEINEEYLAYYIPEIETNGINPLFVDSLEKNMKYLHYREK